MTAEEEMSSMGNSNGMKRDLNDDGDEDKENGDGWMTVRMMGGRE